MRLDALESSAAEAMVSRLQSAGWCRIDQTDDEPGIAAFDRQEVERVMYQLDLLWDAKLDGVDFSLILGVRHLELSALVSRFMGRAATARTAVFGRSLIDLLPHLSPIDLVNRWQVRVMADIELVAEKVAGELEGYGLPFLRSFRNLDDIISYLETEKRYQMMSGQLAVACGIVERRAQAEDALREYADAARIQQGPILLQSQNFVSSFVKYFGFGSEFLL